jgi:NAD(P)-dependent dehydrogenase (short-subunit alcohol dehydrogenase family)
MGTAVVTGSASGIGNEIRKQLEAQGDRVVGIDLRNAEVEADLSSAEGRRKAIDGALEQSGSEIDRLVVAAGLGGHVEDLEALTSVNYFGAVELLDGLRPAMDGRPGAAAVAICSNSAQLAPLDEHPYVVALLDHDEERARELASELGPMAYGASKHALTRAMRRRSQEWGKVGVRINGIAPGPTQTPMLQGTIDHPVIGKYFEQMEIPIGRRGTPEEIAGIVVFLLSEAAGFVHGSIFYADGGQDAMTRPDKF